MNATIVFSEQKCTFPHTDDNWIPKKGENRGGLIYIPVYYLLSFYFQFEHIEGVVHQQGPARRLE